MFEPSCKALQAGRFISRGKSRHSNRIIENWELIFVVSGTLDMREGDSEFHLEPGERLLLRPHRRHGGISDYVPELSFYWLHFLPRTPAAAAELEMLLPHAAVGNRAAMAEYFQLYLARQTDDPGNQLIRDLIWQLIFAEILRPVSGGGAGAPGRAAEVVPARLALAARRIIELNFFSRLNTSAIAAELHCNPDYLGRIYRENFGITITTEIVNRRMELVVRLLNDSVLSIKEIALRSGFEDVGHFRRMFFRRCAMTPHEFRAIHAPGRANSE